MAYCFIFIFKSNSQGANFLLLHSWTNVLLHKIKIPYKITLQRMRTLLLNPSIVFGSQKQPLLCFMLVVNISNLTLNFRLLIMLLLFVLLFYPEWSEWSGTVLGEGCFYKSIFLTAQFQVCSVFDKSRFKSSNLFVGHPVYNGKKLNILQL